MLVSHAVPVGEWQAALERAIVAWPDIRLDPASFLAHAAACREHGATAEHLGDLWLAFAAGSGDPSAIHTIDRQLLPQIDVAVRRIDSASAFLDDVRQALGVHLLVGAADAPPRIRSYEGRGPLLGWMRVAALRIALNLKRSERPTVSDDEVLAELVDREPDPDLRHMKDLYRAELGAALREALAARPERQRVLLRLHFVDGLRLARIAALYGVHEATASRWIKQATEDIATDAQRRLRERLALSPSALGSVAGMVLSSLDLSLSRILR